MTILAYLSQAYRIEQQKTQGHARSPHWPTLRKEWLKANPACAVCGKTRPVVPHHILPFQHWPELELDAGNLITLCESAGMHCHITFGHLGTFTSWNNDCRADVAAWNPKVQARP
jgi:5-methylcytosine-specific restriction endonuclease McrA